MPVPPSGDTRYLEKDTDMTTITTPGSTRSELALRAHHRAPVVVPAEPVFDHAFPEDFDSVFEGSTTQRSTIGCVIPAYNEEESIASVIEGLLAQTRVPDVIHVVVNNTTDKTVQIASQYAGAHEITTELGEQFTEVFVHDIGKNPDKKVGALNYGYALVEGYDYLLGVDGDTIAEEHAVEYLETEIIGDSRIGGISAIYSIDNKPFKGLASFLISGQRSQFAAFNLQNLLRGRNMAVLGGQFSVFSTHALREVMEQNHQSTPWVKDSEVEDSLLSLQIKSAGYLTKISPAARADVGGMTTLRALDAQQVKWTYGAIELMWPGQRGDTKGQPLHPNLRIRWAENFGMLTNLFVRVAFLLLLAASLSIGAFVFSPVWLIPIGMAVLLNLRMAMTMANRTRKDVLFALLIAPPRSTCGSGCRTSPAPGRASSPRRRSTTGRAGEGGEGRRRPRTLGAPHRRDRRHGRRRGDLDDARPGRAVHDPLDRLADRRCRDRPADAPDVHQARPSPARIQGLSRPNGSGPLTHSDTQLGSAIRRSRRGRSDL